MPTGAHECIVQFLVVVVFSWQEIRKQFTKLCAPPLASLLGISEGSSLGNYDFSVFEGQSGIVRFFSVFQLEELQREKESFLREAQNTRMSHCWEYMCHRGRCLDHCQAIRPLKINEIWKNVCTYSFMFSFDYMTNIWCYIFIFTEIRGLRWNLTFSCS